MKGNLYIIGAGGQGKIALEIALKMRKWKNIYFLDDNVYGEVMGTKVIGKAKEAFQNIGNSDIFVAIGNNDIRADFQVKLKKQGAILSTLIHPYAIIGLDVEIGCGTVVMAGSVINCCTSIGQGCIINTGATIDHDCELGDYVHISPGVNIAGNVKIKMGSWLGIGSKVINDISITNCCKIGAGALVIKDIIRSGTYIGIPARRTEKY